jgi:hypothetical protein
MTTEVYIVPTDLNLKLIKRFFSDNQSSRERLQHDVGSPDVSIKPELVVSRLPQGGAQQPELDQEALEHFQDYFQRKKLKLTLTQLNTINY